MQHAPFQTTNLHDGVRGRQFNVCVYVICMYVRCMSACEYKYQVARGRQAITYYIHDQERSASIPICVGRECEREGEGERERERDTETQRERERERNQKREFLCQRVKTVKTH